MTRINVVPPELLCDQHLLAEKRELTRIPNVLHRTLESGGTVVLNGPYRYCLGKGHVKFFYNKLNYLFHRYQDLLEECELRGFNVQNHWSIEVESWARNQTLLWGHWTPDAAARDLNRARIRQRLPANARWTAPGTRPGWVDEIELEELI